MNSAFIIVLCLVTCYWIVKRQVKLQYYKRRLYSDRYTTFIEVKSCKGTVPISMSVLNDSYVTHIEHDVMFAGKIVSRTDNDRLHIFDKDTGKHETIDIEMEVLVDDLVMEWKKK